MATTTLHRQLDRLIETIYDAAIDPGNWAVVMEALRGLFNTSGEAFYFLDFASGNYRPVHLEGVARIHLRDFRSQFFTDDNPWRIHAEALHQPGAIRTDSRLAEFCRDPKILLRSQYYNEWMRPQHFNHTIGTTLHAENGSIANVTLLRPADAGAFRAGEVERFGTISRHLLRAMRIATRLGTIAERREITEQALDRLSCGIVLLDADSRLLYCNAAAETMLRRRDRLTLRNGRLAAINPSERGKLEALLHRFKNGDDYPVPAGITLTAHEPACPLKLTASRFSVHRGLPASPERATLLMIIDPSVTNTSGDIAGILHERYRFTAAESRLAQTLLDGCGIRQAAERNGITYNTARGYLKVLFHKTGTRRQAELVARLIRDLAASPLASSRTRAPAPASATPPAP
ncbi:MAG TPA: PAS domain-containing protein [Burkholderiales bacterium]|nr:PAS domain-containing protein [Burkholderiales bacterium]